MLVPTDVVRQGTGVKSGLSYVKALPAAPMPRSPEPMLWSLLCVYTLGIQNKSDPASSWCQCGDGWHTANTTLSEKNKSRL